MADVTCFKFSKKQMGFTLLELLIALSLLAILAIMTWQGLDILLRSRTSISDHFEIDQQQRRFIEQFQQDCQNIAPSKILGLPTILLEPEQLILILARPTENQKTRWQVVRFSQEKTTAYRAIWTATDDPMTLLKQAQQAQHKDNSTENLSIMRFSHIEKNEFRGWINPIGWIKTFGTLNQSPMNASNATASVSIQAIEWSLYETATSHSPIRVLCLQR